MPNGDEPKIVWSGRFIEAVVDGRWEYVRRVNSHGAIGVIAVTDARELVLVEQYRPPVRAAVIEIPAGLAGDQPALADEPLEATARRELLEETGYAAARWARLFEGVTTAGLADESVTLFLATGLRKIQQGGGDAHEQIRVHLAPLEGLERWLSARIDEGLQVDIKVYLAAMVGRGVAIRDEQAT